MLKRFKHTLTLILLCMLSVSVHAHFTDMILVSGKFSSDQSVPPLTNNASGVAFFTFTPQGDTVDYAIVVDNLSGPITGIHVHQAVAGANGGVVFNLTPNVNGNRVEGFLTGLTMQQYDDLISAQYYVNVHTAVNPGGETRAQLTIEGDWNYSAMLDGAQAGNPVNGMGLGAVTVTHDRQVLVAGVTVADLTTPMNAAHIHQGAFGMNGPPIVDLTPFILGNSIFAFADISSTPSVIDDLDNGNAYINIHTGAFPGGEIRGQIAPTPGMVFQGPIEGAQQVPPSGSSGSGVVQVAIDSYMGMMQIAAAFTDLTGTITAAHLHLGEEGLNGPPVVDLTPGISGNMIMWSHPVDPALLSALLQRDVYINIHTDVAPGGEIRGQLEKMVGEAIIFDLCGAQQVPANAVSGSGIGSFVYNLYATSAHILVGWEGLSSNQAGVHVHNAPVGANGPVFYNMNSGVMNNTVDTYWSIFNLNTPFSSFDIGIQEAGNLYVNLHSIQFPSGELRGQMIDNDLCAPVIATCAVPDALFTTALSQRSAKLNWTCDPSADHYILQGNQTGGTGAVTFVLPAGCPVPFRVQGLQEGTEYWWQVRSVCASGDTSAWSEVDTFMTLCVKPAPIAQQVTGQGQVTLSWTAVAHAPGYKIQGGLVGGGLQTANINDGTITTLVVNNLTDGNYRWRIRANCAGGGNSGYTDYSTFTIISPQKTGETNVKHFDLSIHPNPANDVLNIRMPLFETQAVKVAIGSMNGKLQQSIDFTASTTSADQAIDISDLAPGVYLVHVTFNGSTQSKKLIKY